MLRGLCGVDTSMNAKQSGVAGMRDRLPLTATNHISTFWFYRSGYEIRFTLPKKKRPRGGERFGQSIKTIQG